MGTKLCAAKGMKMTSMVSCTCGTSTVSSWTGAYVVAHNGHDNLLHLWKRHQKNPQKTVLLVHAGHDVENQGPEDNKGNQRDVRRDQEDSHVD